MRLLRSEFNPVPLAVFIPGLGFWRGFHDDLTAGLVGTVAAPPGDVLTRVSWRWQTGSGRRASPDVAAAQDRT